MSTFIQLHLLTNYAPSNLNRDDLGRPKTAKMGGVDRLRISSQSLKRAWRTSDVFEQELVGNIGVRTRKIGVEIYNYLLDEGADKKAAFEAAKAVAGIFGKNEKKDKDDELAELNISQLSHIAPVEIVKAKELAKKLVESGEYKVSKEDAAEVHNAATAVDVALFGRMLAETPEYSVEAAVQVSHALTVNRVVVEDDYFTAVDDLNGPADQGSAHIGESGFGSGVFYTYICINKTQLIESLGDEDLANKAIRALVTAAATVAPSGKQNSYASRSRASYIMAEVGSEQPRQLSSAFLKPVEDSGMVSEAVYRLELLRERMDAAYGQCADDYKVMDVEKGTGTLSDILDFIGA